MTKRETVTKRERRNAGARFNNAIKYRPDAHDRQAFLTPEYVMCHVRSMFGGTIGLDPCTEPGNPQRARKFFCLPTDGCTEPWSESTVWCNPPYCASKDRWVRRCAQEGYSREVLCIIPAHTDTRVFQFALAECISVVFVRGRLKFGALRKNGRQEASSHGSAIFGFGVCVSPLAPLGVVLHVR